MLLLRLRRQLLDALMEKLSQVPGLPFTQVAADAYSRGRPRLAALLLDFETRSSEQAREGLGGSAWRAHPRLCALLLRPLRRL